MKKFDVVLFSGVYKDLAAKPIAIYRLASHLRNHGYRVKTINHFHLFTDEQFSKCIDKFISDETKVVGLSCTVLKSYQNDFHGITKQKLQERLSLIKSRGDIKLVLGGGQVNFSTQEYFHQFDGFDYVSFGQGENTLLAICNHVFLGDKLITNTIQKPYHVSDKTYPFDDFNSSRTIFTQDDDISQGECLPLELARGCIFKCKFCSYELNGKSMADYTRHEEILYDELIYNYENFKTQYYYIIDDLINDSQEKVDMMERVIKRLPFKIYFSGYMRLDILYNNDRMIQQLKDMGLIACFFGIETVNDKSGKAIGKGLGIKRIEETLRLCASIWQNEVHIETNYILGLPYDTPDTYRELMDWIVKALSCEWIHRSFVVPLSINPSLGKSELDINPEKYGYEILDFVSNGRTRYNSPEAKWKKGDMTFDMVKEQANLVNKECLNVYGRTHEVTKFSLPVIYCMNGGKMDISEVYSKYEEFVEKYRKNVDKYITNLLEN